MAIPNHIKEHAALGIGPNAVPNIESSLYGYSIVDMANDDYTMTQAESMCGLLFVANPGDGSKVLTIGAYDTTPIRHSIYVFGSAPIGVKYSGETDVAPAFALQINPVVRIPTVGMIRDQSMSTIKSKAGGTTTTINPDPTAAQEQIIEQLIIPASAWKNTETVSVEFSALKSNTATTETFRLRIGDQGDTTDVQIWSNVGMATTTVAASFTVKIIRLSSTSVSVVTLINALSPNGTSTSSSCFQTVTVDDMDAGPVYISISGQNSTGAESVTSKFIRGVISS